MKSKEKASKSLRLQETYKRPVYANKVLEVWSRVANSIETSPIKNEGPETRLGAQKKKKIHLF